MSHCLPSEIRFPFAEKASPTPCIHKFSHLLFTSSNLLFQQLSSLSPRDQKQSFLGRVYQTGLSYIQATSFMYFLFCCSRVPLKLLQESGPTHFMHISAFIPKGGRMMGRIVTCSAIFSLIFPNPSVINILICRHSCPSTVSSYWQIDDDNVSTILSRD